MADDVSKLSAQAQQAMAEAQKLQDIFFKKSQQGTLEQMSAYAKMAEMQKKVLEQNKEYLKGLEEIKDAEKRRNDLLKEREKLLKSGKKETDVEVKSLDAKLKAERQLHQQRVLSVAEIKKQTQEQTKQLELLTKEKGLMGELAGAFKNKMVQQLAAIATFGNALKQLSMLQQNVLDISVLSGNYKILDQSYAGLAKSAVVFEKNMKEARIGLRFLGYDSAEVDQAFKEFNTTVAMTGVPLNEAADKAAIVTETTGRLARMLGVTLSEATQYSTEMSQRFNQTAGQTASALNEIYLSTSKYNAAADKTVLVSRDITKVMFDLARETKGVALDQAFLSRTVAGNILNLQAQGRTYRESLDQASLYVKKMSTEAPDWTKIFAGRELESQMAQLGGAGGDALRKRLDGMAPGLASRVEGIMKKVTDPYTRQKMLQEALEGTSMGFQAMEKSVGSLIDKMGDKANIALQQIYGINSTQADAMIKQVELSRQLERSKKAIASLDMLTGETREKELERIVKETGLTKEKVNTLAQVKNEHRDAAVATELRVLNEKKSIDAIKQEEAAKKALKESSIRDLKAAQASTTDLDVQASFQKQIDALEGPEKVNSELEAKMAAIQGGSMGEGLSLVYEAITSSTAQLVLLAGFAATQVALQTTIAMNTGGFSKAFSAVKDLFKRGPPGGGGAAKAASTGIEAISTGSKAAKVGMETVETGAKVAKSAGLLGKMASMGGKAMKMAKSVPLVGSAVALGTTGYLAYKAYEKYQRGEKLTAGEMAELGLNAASMIPGVGTVAGMVDAGMSATGGYDALSEPVLKQTPMSSVPSPASTGAGQQSAMSAMPGAMGGASSSSSGQAQASVEIIQGAQGANLKVNFGDIILPIAQVQAYNMGVAAKASRGPTGA